jgi:pimeloyl-ACP methyl ester carboxylesterase
MSRSFLASVALVAGALLVIEAPATLAQVPQGRVLTVNGQQIYYEEEGEGSPLLLLHFFGACGQVWQPHRTALAQDRRLIIPDLRGHGRSSNPTGRFTHRDSAHDLFILLDSLGVDQFEAIGMSSGGMTLIHMDTQQPRRVRSMVLVGATTHFPGQAREIMERAVPDSMSAAEFQQWAQCSSRGDVQTREVIAQFNQMRHSYDDMTFTEPYLGTITARTLIVHGDRDEFFPVSIPIAMYASIPESSLWIVPNGGHIPIFGAWAQAFREETMRFLRGGAN